VKISKHTVAGDNGAALLLAKIKDKAEHQLGDGNDSFHQFTHRLGLGEQPLFDRLGAPLKNFAAVMLSAIDFSGFVVGRNAAENGKTRCLPAVTTKNCFSENGVRSAV